MYCSQLLTLQQKDSNHPDFKIYGSFTTFTLHPWEVFEQETFTSGFAPKLCHLPNVSHTHQPKVGLFRCGIHVKFFLTSNYFRGSHPMFLYLEVSSGMWRKSGNPKSRENRKLCPDCFRSSHLIYPYLEVSIRLRPRIFLRETYSAGG